MREEKIQKAKEKKKQRQRKTIIDISEDESEEELASQDVEIDLLKQEMTEGIPVVEVETVEAKEEYIEENEPSDEEEDLDSIDMTKIGSSMKKKSGKKNKKK